MTNWFKKKKNKKISKQIHMNIRKYIYDLIYIKRIYFVLEKILIMKYQEVS